jgi:hypothetical protein
VTAHLDRPRGPLPQLEIIRHSFRWGRAYLPEQDPGIELAIQAGSAAFTGDLSYEPDAKAVRDCIWNPSNYRCAIDINPEEAE